LQNQLVVDLKSAGVWSKLDTFAMFATNGSSNFALVDWKRLSQYTAVNSPTFTTNQGFTGNGSSSYINTNFNPLTNATQMTTNSSSFGFKIRTGGVSFGVGSGTYFAPNSAGLYINQTAGASTMRSWNNSNSGINAGVNATRVGLFQTDRNNSANIYHIINGVEIANPTLASSNMPNNNLYLLAANAGGATEFQAEQISMAFAGSSFYAQRLSFYNAVNTYLTSI
jgi:hypothetical protein